ncbi:MAG: CaiB/BaiF CoA-transferase family protein [Pseudomonadota bacterium]
MSKAEMPLAGLRVLDFGHTVMGPTAGLVLADLGADVTRVEPPGGDPTRKLKGFGNGYFQFYNRNKKSLALDLKSADGLAIAKRLAARADVLIENFGPGTMARLGLSYDDLKDAAPRLIYLSLKGYLPGPHEDRTALDEVVQMATGLAYMTGPPGQPLRAGASVIDVMGGVFGVIGVLAALRERDDTGQGQQVRASLFESAAFLMGQHLAYGAITETQVPPMTARVSAWSVYDQFDTADQRRVFLGVTSDAQWNRFTGTFGLFDLETPELATNNARIDARGTIIPRITQRLAALKAAEIETLATGARLPFALVARPEDLWDNPHLSGQMLHTALPDGRRVGLPITPVQMGDRLARLDRDPPGIGADTTDVLLDLGLTPKDIAALQDKGVVRAAQEGPENE